MLSNLPPGVTGREDAFGPRDEVDRVDEVECDECGWIGATGILRQSWENAVVDTWDCPECGHETEDDVTDDLYEAHLERLAEQDEDIERYGY